MRLIIIVIVLLFINWPKVSGQSMAFNNSAFAHYEQSGKDNYPSTNSFKRQHCKATIVGEVCMIGGGASLLGAIILIKIEPQNSQDISPLILGVVGVFCIGEGVICFIGGEIYDRTGQRRLSIIGKQNQVGLAYNF